MTSLKVIPVQEIETNKHPHAIWDLVSDSNSIPTKDLMYGIPIRGMRPVGSRGMAKASRDGLLSSWASTTRLDSVSSDRKGGPGLRPGASVRGHAGRSSVVKRVGYVLYGGACYLVTVVTLLYAIAFVAGAPVPRTVDAGGPASAEPPYLSPFNRFEPSTVGCHPNTRETMNPSILRSVGALSLTVDL